MVDNSSIEFEEGDLYIFVDTEGYPHIAVKMRGEEIDEIRGLKNWNAQEIQAEYKEVAIAFLTKYAKIKNVEEWLRKEEWNKRLIEWKRKIETGEFTIEDMPAFIADYIGEDPRDRERFGVKEYNTNKRALT